MTFEDLIKRTRELTAVYSTDLKRYKVVTQNEKEPPLTSQQTLQQLYGRINDGVIKCVTDRVDARDVFSLLTAELRQVKDESTKDMEIKSATLLLLGALLHRFFRIIYECEEQNSKTYYRFKFPVSSGLYNAISKALQLNIKKLDVVTIVNALAVFRENMFSVVDVKETGPDGTPRIEKKYKYMTYPKFLTQAVGSFQKNLDAMIDDHIAIDEGRAPKRHFLLAYYSDIYLPNIYGANLLKQFKAIAFIQSFANLLEAENVAIEGAVHQWCVALQKSEKNFGKLTIESIKDHLKLHFDKNESMYFEIVDLLKKQFVISYLQGDETKPDHSTFEAALKECNSGSKFRTLRGVYYFLFECGLLKPDLVKRLKDALCVQGCNDLPRDELIKGIRFVKKFMVENPDAVLHYGFFGGQAAMMARLKELVPDTTVVAKAPDDLSSFSMSF